MNPFEVGDALIPRNFFLFECFSEDVSQCCEDVWKTMFRSPVVRHVSHVCLYYIIISDPKLTAEGFGMFLSLLIHFDHFQVSPDE